MKRTIVFVFAVLLAVGVGFVGFAPRPATDTVAGDPAGCVACHTHIPWPR